MSWLALAVAVAFAPELQVESRTWEACFDGDAPTPAAYVAFREASQLFRDAGSFGARVTLASPDQGEGGWPERPLTAHLELIRAGIPASFITGRSEGSGPSQCLSVTVEVLPPAQNPPRLWHLGAVYGFEPGVADVQFRGGRATVGFAAVGYAPGWVVRVDGHTDTVGSAEENRALSRRRAEAVAAALVREGVPWEDIEINGHGETLLARPTADETPEPLNRRVNIDLWRRPATPH